MDFLITKGKNKMEKQIKELNNIDFNSNNPLEEDLIHLNLLTRNQYHLIKRFQKAFLKHKEQNSIALYEPKTNTNGGKSKSQLEEIADVTFPYIKYLNMLWENLTHSLIFYFCSNNTMKKIKQAHTTFKTEIKTIAPKRKKNKKTKGEAKQREITVEEFNRDGAMREILEIVEIVERVEYMMADEYERVMLRLKRIVEKMGKYEIAKSLNINYRTLDKILNKWSGLRYKTFLQIKEIVNNNF
jgi:hypothetical protein